MDYETTKEIASEREAFRREFVQCWICDGPAHDVHEIARGVHRKQALDQRCCWLRICRNCHDRLDDYVVWPIVRQLALKLIRDPEGYDRRKVNRIRGRADDAIDEKEVALEVSKMCYQLIQRVI